jgi:hypothetical protein
VGSLDKPTKIVKADGSPVMPTIFLGVEAAHAY